MPISPLFPRLAVSGLALLAIAGALAAHACSTCGCSVCSRWGADDSAPVAGWEATFRYDYLNQSDLYSGTGKVDRAALTFPNDQEIQQRTLTRTVWLDLTYAVSPGWTVQAQLPYADRFHTTVAGGDTDISTSQASGLGDVRLLARRQSDDAAPGLSFEFGFKLPTGRFDQNFANGPQAGSLLDRGLQLGTGTFDLLAGATWSTRLTDSLGFFSQINLAQPLAARAGFLPSSNLHLSTGVRWLAAERITPELQLNLGWEGREHGVQADTPNSGGLLAYLSPGLTARLTSSTRAFAFVQLPVYRRVNGLQLEPRWILSLGTRFQF
ncbi:MAG: hypothetical protein ACHQ5A_07215 [Opitutales bacterium]